MDKKQKEKLKECAYNSFLKLLNDGDVTIADILNDYIDMRERVELIMDGASEAIETYKNKK